MWPNQNFGFFLPVRLILGFPKCKAANCRCLGSDMVPGAALTRWCLRQGFYSVIKHYGHMQLESKGFTSLTCPHHSPSKCLMGTVSPTRYLLVTTKTQKPLLVGFSPWKLAAFPVLWKFAPGRRLPGQTQVRSSKSCILNVCCLQQYLCSALRGNKGDSNSLYCFEILLNSPGQ